MALPKRLVTAVAAGMAAVGVMAAPHDAKAWWHGGFGVGIVVPPVVVAPAPYYPAPVYGPSAYTRFYGPPPYAYFAPRRAWIPAHWQGPYWVPGHWG